MVLSDKFLFLQSSVIGWAVAENLAIGVLLQVTGVIVAYLSKKLFEKVNGK